VTWSLLRSLLRFLYELSGFKELEVFVVEATPRSNKRASNLIEAGSSPINQFSQELLEADDTKGGIDFNPSIMEIESRGRSDEFIFEFDNQRNVTTNINGLIPIIINVTPVTNMLLLLGEYKVEEDQLLGQL